MNTRSSRTAQNLNHEQYGTLEYKIIHKKEEQFLRTIE